MKVPAVFRKRGVCLAVLLAVLLMPAPAVLAAGGGEEGPTGWMPTDTYRVFNFLVLAAALVLVLRKPLSQALGGRIKQIRQQLDDLERRKAAAEAALAEYNQRLAKLDEEAETIVQGYIQQGRDAHDRILKEAEAAAEKLEEQARRNIDHEFAQARQALQTEIFEKALSKAEERIREQMTAEDQDRLVDDYLTKVVA